MWNIIALHATYYCVLPTIGDKGGRQSVERQEGDEEEVRILLRFSSVFWLCTSQPLRNKCTAQFAVLDKSAWDWCTTITLCNHLFVFMHKYVQIDFFFFAVLCAYFCIIQAVAGLCVRSYVQYVCLCTRAHRWGLVVRASLDWPINYDGLLMMCNGMIY